MQSTKNGSTSEYNNKNFITLIRVIKLHDTDKESVCLAQISQSSRPYFSMVKMLLGLVALMWATVSSRPNTQHVRSPSLVSGAFSI